MPRRPRIHVPGGLYHAILRGNHRQAIFFGGDAYRLFEGILAEALARFDARLHAYCWMINHVHLAIQIADAPLGQLVQLVASRYARAIQRRVPTTGHLFERRYRAKNVAADRYHLALVRYIHLNPVRAGMVTDPASYPWSSHCAYLGLAPSDWLTIQPTLAMFGTSLGEARAAYLCFMAEKPGADELSQLRPRGPGRKNRGAASDGLTDAASQIAMPSRADPVDLEQIVVEVAAEFGVAVAELNTRSRVSRLVLARTEIARRALRTAVATLSQVAARMGRSPSSLSELLSKN